MMTDHDDKPVRVRPSRSQKKRAVQAFEVLARELAEMSPQQFLQVTLPVELSEEIEQARRTKGHGSRKRQIKFLAGFLRRHEDGTRQLIAAVEHLHLSHHTHQVLFHRVEHLRDRLCQPDQMESALREIGEELPDIDAQELIRLATQVHHFADRRARREIFKRLREALEQKDRQRQHST